MLPMLDVILYVQALLILLLVHLFEPLPLLYGIEFVEIFHAGFIRGIDAISVRLT